MSETQLSKSILDALNLLHGCRFWRSPSGRERGGRQNIGPPKGTPDIIGYVGPLFCSIEVKSKERLKDRTSQTYLDQVAWRSLARKNGASCNVVSSPSEAIEIVRALIRKTR